MNSRKSPGFPQRHELLYMITALLDSPVAIFMSWGPLTATLDPGVGAVAVVPIPRRALSLVPSLTSFIGRSSRLAEPKELMA